MDFIDYTYMNTFPLHSYTIQSEFGAKYFLWW